MSCKPFFSNCVSWCSNAPLQSLEWLCENADEISLEDFRQRVDPDAFDDILSSLGYAQEDDAGIRVEDDYHVDFRVERRTGIPFMIHSAIEYVFATEDDLERVAEMVDMETSFEP